MDQARHTDYPSGYVREADILCPYCKIVALSHWRKLNFWQCPSCKLIFRHPLPEMESIVELYESSWTSPYENRSETGGTSIQLARKYVRKLADTLEKKDLSGYTLLDFGAGRGDAIIALSELGADVYGVEPFGYDELKKQGFKIFRSLDEIPNNLTFDGIYSRDVIEHLRNPWIELQKFNDILAQNGFIYIATPNASSLSAKIHGERWREALRSGHLMLFTPSCLEAMLEYSGYKRYKRLKWFIKYSENPLRNIVQYILKTIHLDGELHYLVTKS